MRLFNHRHTYTTPGGSYSALYADMMTQPHLLVAGATGSGKSVVINGIVHAAMHHAPGTQPGGVELILIDPKRVELVQYKFLPHTICYATEPGQIVNALRAAMSITESRYAEMQSQRLRKYPGGDVYVIIDEFADLILMSSAVKPLIQRIAQIGRAAKVHIILATQTPIAKVIPTEIKCNFDARVGLRTRSAQDSRNIIGRSGLETLPAYGQGRYITPKQDTLYNIPMIPDEELDRLVEFWERQSHRYA